MRGDSPCRWRSSSWLLQLFGIGPKAALEAAGIPVKKVVPIVDANLQGHPQYP